LQASFSPDGRRVVTVSDKTARVWDADTGQALTPPLRHENLVLQASFSADGRRVVTASLDSTPRVWDAATGLLMTPPLRHEGKVLQASFSPNGSRLLTASQDKTARIWDVTGDDRPWEDLLLLSHVLSGQRIDATGANVAAEISEAEWQRLRQRYPDAFAPARGGQER
jgi:WD40 repeat protein